MDEPLSTRSTWRTIADAHDDLAGAPHHRALAGHACSCGEELDDAHGLAQHLEDVAAADAPTEGAGTA
jgi:hypothetical protein